MRYVVASVVTDTHTHTHTHTNTHTMTTVTLTHATRVNNNRCYFSVLHRVITHHFRAHNITITMDMPGLKD